MTSSVRAAMVRAIENLCAGVSRVGQAPIAQIALLGILAPRVRRATMLQERSALEMDFVLMGGLAMEAATAMLLTKGPNAQMSRQRVSRREHVSNVQASHLRVSATIGDCARAMVPVSASMGSETRIAQVLVLE